MAHHWPYLLQCNKPAEGGHVTSHADTCALVQHPQPCRLAMQVAADLGAKSIRGNDRLTAEEQEIDATDFVDEGLIHQPDAPLEQQQPVKVLSSGSLEGQVSDPGSVPNQHELARECATQNESVSVSPDNLDHIRHSYRHGRLHDDDNNGQASGTAELQVA